MASLFSCCDYIYTGGVKMGQNAHTLASDSPILIYAKMGEMITQGILW